MLNMGMAFPQIETGSLLMNWPKDIIPDASLPNEAQTYFGPKALKVALGDFLKIYFHSFKN